MTFDDGILTIYSVENMAKSGKKPVYGLVEKSKHYFGYQTLGVTRYYEAKKADSIIESVVRIPDWNNILATDICILENDVQYRLSMVQPTMDENNLRITILSLERNGEQYAIKT
ncbi:MAG TPA: hypothetical protein DEQ64_09005 [Lachnoclostridium sp.]|jgi:hypothetical protein|uniref:hypothetical protein n=1 Tax=Lacrimispora sp. TaxID=2719234 RepID=UPI000EE1E096|nr:hypothetical protein [Lacrimispora sp.]HCD43855.1 hypothetical protein [Lachnoclostridium sp.]